MPQIPKEEILKQLEKAFPDSGITSIRKEISENDNLKIKQLVIRGFTKYDEDDYFSYSIRVMCPTIHPYSTEALEIAIEKFPKALEVLINRQRNEWIDDT